MKKHPVVLVTGASTGLGLAIARALLKKKYHVIVTARAESIERFAQAGIVENENCWIRPLDVLSLGQGRDVVREIEAKLGAVDVLINNAGFSLRSVVEHVRHDEAVLQIRTNFLAPMDLARFVLPGMRKQRSGHIVNISSVGGMMAMPTMGVYSASKFALEGASEALYYEVKPWNIHVTLVEPGFIHSDSFEKVRYTAKSEFAADDEAEPYFPHYHYMSRFIKNLMTTSRSTPEKVARKVLKVIESQSPPLRVAGTLDAVVFDLLRRFLPRRFYHWVLYRSLPHISQWGREKEEEKKAGNRRKIEHADHEV